VEATHLPLVIAARAAGKAPGKLGPIDHEMDWTQWESRRAPRAPSPKDPRDPCCRAPRGAPEKFAGPAGLTAHDHGKAPRRRASFRERG
jgi:hypothetical protein